MRKLFTISILIASSVWILASCKKEQQDFNCPSIIYYDVASQTDEIRNYLSQNAITATLHESGFYYHIINEGNGKSIDKCSEVTVNYTGKLANNTVFDGTNDMTFSLSNLIHGWRLGLPLIKEGGKIILYIPAYLAYGSDGVPPSIPGNAMTIFEIEVNKVH